MNIFQALILGVVEGLTEFLPISSTAHLIIASKFLGLSQTEFITFFEVFIQTGAILAVVVLYFQYILHHKKYLKPLFYSFIPTAIVGLLLHTIVKTVFFDSPLLIYSSLILVGIVFLIIEYLVKQGKLELKRSLDEITPQDAIIFGLFQACAVVPGVSRAGAVMVGMMMRGYKREESAIYSFLLAVPTIFAASALDIVKTDLSIIANDSHLYALIVGFSVSFITAYIVIKWLINYLQSHTLEIFGVYRIILGISLLLLLK